MPSAIDRLASRPFVLLAALGGSALLGPLVSPPAHAYGFTGQFAPSNWVLNSYVTADPGGLPLPQTELPPPGSGFQQGFPNYQCADPLDAGNCVYGYDVNPFSATIVGSDTIYNGNPGDKWSSQWEMLNAYSGPTKVIDFQWLFRTNDSEFADQSFYYVLDASRNVVNYIPLSSKNGQSGPQTVTLENGYFLGFGVYSATNDSGPGRLEITKFDVPAPLPLLGAGAAFGWSRRLRRRLRLSSGSLSR